ncbi:DUF6653 family protein [Halorubrum sp. HHNYT27]|uniref:DUF6653 family protein n=1 Tax=Halorubrum sp. HHNYT27 TaxID=3402275 RepID=UPI003EBED5FE
MAGIDADTFWKRHENPLSVWWFILMYPIIVLTLYRRSRTLGGCLLASLPVNLFVVSPPKSDDAWATRVVRGEQVWLEQGVLSSTDLLLLTTLGGVVHLYTFRAALHRRPVRTAVGTVVSLILMLLFFDQMAELYERTRESEDES